MAWISGTDIFNSKKLGESGSAIVGSVRKIFYNEDTALTEFNPIDTGSSWNEILYIEDFNATNNTNKIEIFNGKNLSETLEGKTTSELKITQIYKGWLNSIGKLKGKQLWFLQAFTDDRDPVNADGTAKLYELRFYNGKLTSVSEEFGDAESIAKIVGDGSFTVDSQRKIFRGITPVNVTATPSGGATFTSTQAKAVTVSATDFASSSVDITDLSVAALMGEVTSIDIIKKSGTATVVVADGADDATKQVTMTGTGSVTIYAEITTANGGKFVSADVECTVS